MELFCPYLLFCNTLALRRMSCTGLILRGGASSDLSSIATTLRATLICALAWVSECFGADALRWKRLTGRRQLTPLRIHALDRTADSERSFGAGVIGCKRRLACFVTPPRYGCASPSH